MRTLVCLVFFFFSFFLFQCNSTVEDPIDESVYGYDYYPLEVGKYRTYKVDSIQFDVGARDLPVVDSSSFYLRVEIVEVYKDHEGIDIYRAERHRGTSVDGPWDIVDVLTYSRSVNQGFYTENNVRLINLVFPVEEGVIWDGNSYVKDDLIVFINGESIEMFKGWNFEITSEGVAEEIGGNNYPETATIVQADTDNIIEKRYSTEKYAKGVGLVFRERQIVDSYCKYIGVNDQCVNKEWIEKAGRGFFMREVLVEHN